MKSLLLVLSFLTFSSYALAAPSFDLECTSSNRAGAVVVNVDGMLFLYKHPTYPSPAKLTDGVLDIEIKTLRDPKPIFKGEVIVKGQYDKVSFSEYAHLAIEGRNGSVYIDFSGKDTLSTIELDGKTYHMSCKRKN